MTRLLTFVGMLFVLLLLAYAGLSHASTITPVGTNKNYGDARVTIDNNLNALNNDKAEKSATVMLWSAWPDGTTFTTVYPPFYYNGTRYKCISPYTKTSGDAPDDVDLIDVYFEVDSTSSLVPGTDYLTPEAIAGAYQPIMATASESEITTGTETALRAVSPALIKLAAETFSGAGSMTWPSAAGIAYYGGSSAWGDSIVPGTGIAAGLAVGFDAAGGFVSYDNYADDPTFAVNTTYFSFTVSGSVGTLDIQDNIFQPYLGTVTTGLTAGGVYYMASGGVLTVADADGTTTYPARCVAVSATQCISQGEYTSSSHGLTVGATLWLSTTAGEYTTTQPSATGDAIQVIGWIKDANTLVIDVDGNYATVQ